jgi:hypothetical protein
MFDQLIKLRMTVKRQKLLKKQRKHKTCKKATALAKEVKAVAFLLAVNKPVTQRRCSQLFTTEPFVRAGNGYQCLWCSFRRYSSEQQVLRHMRTTLHSKALHLHEKETENQELRKELALAKKELAEALRYKAEGK